MAEPPGKSSAPRHFFLSFPEQRRDGRGPGTRLNREAASRQEAMCKEAQQEVPGSEVTLTPGPALSEERTSRSPRPRLRLAVFLAAGQPVQFRTKWGARENPARGRRLPAEASPVPGCWGAGAQAGPAGHPAREGRVVQRQWPGAPGKGQLWDTQSGGL